MCHCRRSLLLLACLALAPQARADEPADTLTVVASGTGTDEKAALKQAFSNAITQAVGSIVDVETVVKNDRVISDQVLTASNAIVTHYDPIGAPAVIDGLTTVKIKAVIERKQLTDRLAAANVISRDVSGSDLAARMTTDLAREKDAAAIVGRVFRDFPANVLKAEPVGEPRVVKKTADGGEIGVKVRFSVDAAKYAQWCSVAVPTLSKLGRRTQTVRWNPVKDYTFKDATKFSSMKFLPESDSVDAIEASDLRNAIMLNHIEHAPWPDVEDLTLRVFERQGSSKVDVITLGADDQVLTDALLKSVCAAAVVEVTLLDGAKQEIDGQEAFAVFNDQDSRGYFDVSTALVRYSFMGRASDKFEALVHPQEGGKVRFEDLKRMRNGDLKTVCLQVLPYCGSDEGLFVPGFSREFRFLLTNDQVSAIKSVQVKSSNRLLVSKAAD